MSAMPRRILIIDHDERMRRLLCEQLTGLGFTVTEEDTGISGLSRMASQATDAPFHGLLLELQLPVVGGLAVLQEISQRFPMVPIIAMSNAHHVGQLRQAVKLGAKEYLLKPFDPELLRRKCMSVFHDHQVL